MKISEQTWDGLLLAFSSFILGFCIAGGQLIMGIGYAFLIYQSISIASVIIDALAGSKFMAYIMTQYILFWMEMNELMNKTKENSDD